MSKSSDVVVRRFSLEEAGTTLAAEWDELYAAQALPGNPFTSRIWVTTWFRHFADPADAVLLAVYEGDRLIGVAPWNVQRLAVGPVTVGRRLVLAGAAVPQSPIELPPLLSRAGHGRTVSRAVVAALLGAAAGTGPLAGRLPDFGWAEFSLSRDQGWFEPEWVYGTGRRVAFYKQQTTRACVVLPLSSTWEETKSGLKRNIKESLRRSRNRLAKENHQLRLISERQLDTEVVDRLLGLHGARAGNESAGFRHPDLYAEPARRAFLRELLPALASAGEAIIAELLLDDRVVASQLALVAPGCTYFHSSGFLPEVWSLNPTTALQESLIVDAVKNGHGWVNFSPGPNVSKLRWSEVLHRYDDFAFGAGGRRVGMTFAAFAQRAALQQTRHAIAMAGASSSRDQKG